MLSLSIFLSFLLRDGSEQIAVTFSFTVIVQCSCADLLILINNDKVTHDEENRITFPLYDIGFKTGMIISPMVYTLKDWANHRVTPFYENVNRDGIVL